MQMATSIPCTPSKRAIPTPLKDAVLARDYEFDMTRKRYIPLYYKSKTVVEVSRRGVVF
jgi:hypothetical protein